MPVAFLIAEVSAETTALANSSLMLERGKPSGEEAPEPFHCWEAWQGHGKQGCRRTLAPQLNQGQFRHLSA